MTYIFEMASGTEYPGDEVGRPHPAKAPGAPLARTEQGVEPGLAQIEVSPSTAPEFPAGLYLDALIRQLDD